MITFLGEVANDNSESSFRRDYSSGMVTVVKRRAEKENLEIVAKKSSHPLGLYL